MKRLILLPLAAFFLACSAEAPEATNEFRNESFEFISAQRTDYLSGKEQEVKQQTDHFTYLSEVNSFKWSGPDSTNTYKPIKQTQNNFWVLHKKDTLLFRFEGKKLSLFPPYTTKKFSEFTR